MLKSIRIQNFKSLKDVSLDLQDVVLLIGPNNSGKSSVLKALKTLSIITNYESRGSFSEEETRVFDRVNESTFNKVPFFDKKSLKINPIKFKLNFFLNGKDVNYYIDFFGFTSYGKSPVYSELIDFDCKHEFDSILDFGFEMSKDFIYHSLHNEYYKDKFDLKLDQFRYSGHIYDFCFKFVNNEVKVVYPLKNSISKGIRLQSEFLESPIEQFFPDKIFSPDIGLIQLPHTISNDEIYLMESCANLAPFIYKLDSDFPTEFQDLLSDLKKCISEIYIVKSTVVGEGAFSIRVHEKSGISHLIEDVSDGVIYFLALLSIVHQPNPPKVLLLEEPENGIHPRRIVEILEFIYKLVYDKGIQIIMTSHSPTLVDQFNDSLESVFVFDKENGETTIKNLRKIIDEENKLLGEDRIDYHSSLGAHWTMGFLGGVPK